MVTALALCKYSLAELNTTEQPANNTVSLHHQGNTNNFKDSIETATQAKKSGHFTKCTKELRQYCIHGSCRFVKEQNTPSCRCERGYIGSRCEYVDLASRLGDKRQIIVVCVIAALVFLILLITFICICAQWVKYTFLKHQTARLLYVVTFHVCVCLYLFVFVCLWEWEVAIQTQRLTACHTNPGMGCKESMCVPWMEK